MHAFSPSGSKLGGEGKTALITEPSQFWLFAAFEKRALNIQLSCT
jgi:hypothetical protein